MTALAAEAQYIHRLQLEVYCLESTLRAMGKTNRCSRALITLNSRLDAAKDELYAALEDQEHLRSISDSSHCHCILSSSSSSDSEESEHHNTPSPPSTLINFSQQHVKDQLEQTPKYTLPWFELKQQVREYDMISDRVAVSTTISMQDEPPTKQLRRSNSGLDNLLLEVCASHNFDIAEIWLHKDKDYRLINSHVRRSNLDTPTYDELQEVYQEGPSDQIHQLSLSLCKWSKKVGFVLWITEQATPRLAQALKYSISEVKAAVAVPIYHEGVYATMIYFGLNGSTSFVPGAEEDYLVEMSEKVVRECLNNRCN